jgi:hypothetical protein
MKGQSLYTWLCLILLGWAGNILNPGLVIFKTLPKKMDVERPLNSWVDFQPVLTVQINSQIILGVESEIYIYGKFYKGP